MTSFLELPRLDYQGRDRGALYVNVADIITIQTEYEGTTRLDIRDNGSEGMASTCLTYMPVPALLEALHELATSPGVFTWSDDSKARYLGPAMTRFQAAHA